MPDYTLQDYLQDKEKRIIELDALNGVPSEFESIIHDTVAKYDLIEKLLVALYFMSDLAPEDHTFANIEVNLRKLFKQPEGFKNFRQTCIGQFVYSSVELFERPQRGRWINSDAGNSEAKRLLAKKNILVNKRTNG